MVLLGAALPASSPAKGCDSFQVTSGPYGKVAVKVKSGKTSCRLARKTARRMFSGEGCHHDTGVTGSSYYQVGRWRGNAHMGEWHMRNVDTGARISGTYQMKPGGTTRDSAEC